MGAGQAEGPGHRPLVADRDRLGHRRQSDGPRRAAGQDRLADRRHARLRRAGARRCRPPVPAGTLGNIVVKLPLPPGLPADAVERRRALPLGLSRRVPRLLQNVGRGLHRRGRLPLHHGAHRRHHQCRRPPACRPAPWRRSSPAIPTSPNAPSSASPTQLKGQLPAGFIVLNSGVDRPSEEIEKEVVKLVRDEIGPVAAFKIALTSTACPRPVPARSCAAPCRRSPTARTLEDAGDHRRSRRSSTRSARSCRSARSARRPRPDRRIS
jgi:hypothetical protein